MSLHCHTPGEGHPQLSVNEALIRCPIVDSGLFEVLQFIIVNILLNTLTALICIQHERIYHCNISLKHYLSLTVLLQWLNVGVNVTPFLLHHLYMMI